MFVVTEAHSGSFNSFLWILWRETSHCLPTCGQDAAWFLDPHTLLVFSQQNLLVLCAHAPPASLYPHSFPPHEPRMLSECLLNIERKKTTQ